MSRSWSRMCGSITTVGCWLIVSSLGIPVAFHLHFLMDTQSLSRSCFEFMNRVGIHLCGIPREPFASFMQVVHGRKNTNSGQFRNCLLYTSDAADDLTRVDLG